MGATSKPPPQAQIAREEFFTVEKTYGTPVVAAAPRLGCSVSETDKQTNKRTDKQTNKWTSTSRKAPPPGCGGGLMTAFRSVATELMNIEM